MSFFSSWMITGRSSWVGGGLLVAGLGLELMFCLTSVSMTLDSVGGDGIGREASACFICSMAVVIIVLS